MLFLLLSGACKWYKKACYTSTKIIDAVEKLYLLPSMGRKVPETDEDEAYEYVPGADVGVAFATLVVRYVLVVSAFKY